MSQTLAPGGCAPDNPMRRLPWVLALALLLVALGLLGLGRTLSSPTVQPIKPKPLQAQIYELPPSHQSVAGSPVQGGLSAPAAQPTPRQVEAAHQPLAEPHRQPRIKIPRVASTRPQVHRPSTHPRRSTGAGSAHTPAPYHPRHLTLASLDSDIDSAVGQIDSSIPQVRDPHTLVARYYLKSLLLKLERVGDMNIPTHLTGVPVVQMVIGVTGELRRVTLLRSSGNPRLDNDAMQIARDSSPFAPFPPKLARQTGQITLVCYMRFMGYRQLYTGF